MLESHSNTITKKHLLNQTMAEQPRQNGHGEAPPNTPSTRPTTIVENPPPPDKYIAWNAPGVEVEQAGEREKIWEVSEQFKRFQMMNFNMHAHCFRGTHLKTQGVSDEILRFFPFSLARSPLLPSLSLHLGLFLSFVSTGDHD
jgi:hypothetical protein